MSQWYVKELSKLTIVSVQTLHHYDRIDLLNPSLRLDNGYRLYSEKDLLKLQQIIALKFFGFSLTQIKNILSKPVDMIDQFNIQSSLLEMKANNLLATSQTLKEIIQDYTSSKAIAWETIIKLIDVYRIMAELEKTALGKKFTPEELKAYASFEHEVKIKFSEIEQQAFEKAWDDLVSQVKANLNKDPHSAFGITLGELCMEWVNSYYGREYATVRTTLWEKGIREGYLSAETGLSIEEAQWLDQAIDAHVNNRTLTIFNLIGSYPQETILKRWEDMLNDYFGNDHDKAKEFCRDLLDDHKTLPAAKKWLKSYIKTL